MRHQEASATAVAACLRKKLYTRMLIQRSSQPQWSKRSIVLHRYISRSQVNSQGLLSNANQSFNKLLGRSMKTWGTPYFLEPSLLSDIGPLWAQPAIWQTVSICSIASSLANTPYKPSESPLPCQLCLLPFETPHKPSCLKRGCLQAPVFNLPCRGQINYACG